MAACAASGVPIVTNANPRERPLMRSVIRLTSETVPNSENMSWRSFSVVSKERFPTYNLVFMQLLLGELACGFRAVPDYRVSNHHRTLCSPEDSPCTGILQCPSNLRKPRIEFVLLQTRIS